MVFDVQRRASSSSIVVVVGEGDLQLRCRLELRTFQRRTGDQRHWLVASSAVVARAEMARIEVVSCSLSCSRLDLVDRSLVELADLDMVVVADQFVVV